MALQPLLSSASKTYFLFDTETGGFKKERSLLTLHGLVLGSSLEIKDEIALEIRPLNGIYMVEAQAMAVNHIDLVEHDKTARDLTVCRDKFRDFVFKHTALDKMTVIGQGVHADIKFVKHHLFTDPNWSNCFNRRYIDTGGIALFLQQVGKIPPDVECSLKGLVKHFDISHDPSTLHNCKVDAMLTLAVYRKLVSIIAQ